jgi:hypothetical protein
MVYGFIRLLLVPQQAACAAGRPGSCGPVPTRWDVGAVGGALSHRVSCLRVTLAPQTARRPSPARAPARPRPGTVPSGRCASTAAACAAASGQPRRAAVCLPDQSQTTNGFSSNVPHVALKQIQSCRFVLKAPILSFYAAVLLYVEPDEAYKPILCHAGGDLAEHGNFSD